MLLLNLGCGSQVHPDWVNIDHFPRAWLRHLPFLCRFGPSSLPPNFVNCDLRRGIPFTDSKADAIYSSHLMEHLPLTSVRGFLREQWRVLKPGGVIRIVVPDLEFAARQYIQALDRIRAEGQKYSLEHEWATILLLDQMVRIRGGGRMLEWLVENRNSEFVQSLEGNLRQISQTNGDRHGSSLITRLRALLRHGFYPVSPGEKHLWMYDAVALELLVSSCGFRDVIMVDSDTSRIPNWSHFYLDRSIDGTLHQPGSIYLEGIK